MIPQTVAWVRVIDVSRNQGAIDFAKMYATGVRKLILRVSNGQTIDDQLANYWRQALDAGFRPADIAFYTFVNPKRGTGAQCAKATLDAIRNVVGHTNVGYMLDVENYRNESPNVGSAPVYGPAFAAHIREHINTVRSLAPGAHLFGYSNLAYWNGPAAPGFQWVGDDELAAEIEWLAARYPAYSDAAYARTGYPGTPDTWPDWAFKAQPLGPLPPRGGKWWGWQFSAGFNHQGPVYGATSRDLDLNIVHPDAWARWTGTSAATIAPQPDLREDDDMKLATNEEERQMPWGLSAPRTEIFIIGTRKRSVSPEEYNDLYGNAPAAPLTNSILDSIPDEALETASTPTPGAVALPTATVVSTLKWDTA